MGPLEKLMAAARQHGLDSDPDQEVGDLQDVLRSCWDRLSPEARVEIFNQYKERVHEWLKRREPRGEEDVGHRDLG
jgi:hypothetical protein